MLKHLRGYCQQIIPQHLLTDVVGKVAKCKNNWLKNNLIDLFCHYYHVDMSEAIHTDSHAYASFNQFFIRALKDGARSIDPDTSSIVSPVDGTVSQIGQITGNQLLQAKNMYFSLESLLGNQHELANTFRDGQFATLYLAPKDYHRVHMPIAGTLTNSIYVPGKLFSVNRMTSEVIPNLYARNERLILTFDTQAGPMAVILVGAMIVGSIQTVWMDAPISSKSIQISPPSHEISLSKGDQLGHFEMGSTVILLFNNKNMQWVDNMGSNAGIKFGQTLAKLMVS